MDRNYQKISFRAATMALLIAGLGLFAGCGGGGGSAAPAPATAPGAFVLLAPTGAGIDLSPTLSWGSAAGVTTYTVEVTTDSTFGAITAYENTTIPAGTTSVLVSGLSPSTVYYWRVIAVNAIGATTASDAPFSFTTKKSGDVAWFQVNDPSPIDDQSYGMVLSGTNMYVVGYDSNTTAGDDQWHIEKRAQNDGSLVPSFGTTTPGVVVYNPSGTAIGSYDDAYAVAVDSTALYVVGFDSVAGDDDWGWRIEKRDLVTGASITGFGSNGAVSENINSGPGLDDVAFAAAVDSNPTGTLYVVGYETTVLNGTEWRIEARNKATGSLVTSETSSISIDDDSANAIAIDPIEGYMYVVGTDYSSSDAGWRIEKRSLSDIQLETTTFGGASGIIQENPSSGVDEPMAIILDQFDSTHMYIAGYEYDTGTLKFRWRIEKRLRSDGSLENTTFGGGSGYVVSSPTPTPTNAVAQAIAIDGSYLYVAGYDNASSLGGTLEWRVEKRSLTTGALDTTFGNNGVYVNDFGTPSLKDSIRAIAVDATYVYVAGYESVNAINSRWRIEKIVK